MQTLENLFTNDDSYLSRKLLQKILEMQFLLRTFVKKI